MGIDLDFLQEGILEIQLNPNLLAYVEETVAGGQFASASDLIREALLAFQVRESFEGNDLDSLRQLLHGRIAHMDSGKGIPLNAEAIKNKARARYDAERAG